MAGELADPRAETADVLVLEYSRAGAAALPARRGAPEETTMLDGCEMT